MQLPLIIREGGPGVIHRVGVSSTGGCFGVLFVWLRAESHFMTQKREVPPALLGTPFSSAEAREHGLGRGAFRRPEIVRIGYDRYVVRSAVHPLDPLESLRDLMTAVPPDAALSHWTAATIWRLPSRATDRPHVTLDSALVPPQRDELIMHTRKLPDSDIVERDGIRVTSPERTYLDLAESVRLHEVVALGDTIVRLGLSTVDLLDARVAEAHRRRGVVVARKALPYVDGRAQSPPESYARLWITRAGLPAPVPQLPVFEGGRLLGHADLGYEEWRLGLEYEGRDHAKIGQFGYDIDRYTRMSAAGWAILRFSSQHLRHDGKALVSLTAQALRSRGFSR